MTRQYHEVRILKYDRDWWTYSDGQIEGVPAITKQINPQRPQLSTFGKSHFVAAQIGMALAAHNHVFVSIKHQSYWTVHPAEKNFVRSKSIP